MAYKKPYSGKFDTPTDGISKKVFDRYKDQQVRRHVRLAEDISELKVQVRALLARKR